jgi:lactoylglutathione lyase
MHIEHVAIWTDNIALLKAFYENYFEARAVEKHTNAGKRSESSFFSLPAGARFERMRVSGLLDSSWRKYPLSGNVHQTFSSGSMTFVDALTARLQADGCRVIDEPQHTGACYCESGMLDPNDNRVELTL